jgi:hypothetical protein
MGFVLRAFCAFLWLLIEFLFIDLALTFFNRDDSVHAGVGNFVDRAVGPTNLDRIDSSALLETEV